jgi:hypothetical protein
MMNKRAILLLTLCLPVVLFFAGCQPANQSLIPVTGEDFSPVPLQIMLAREHVLEYINSLSRLPSIPPKVMWQLKDDEQPEGEYYFYSGDWLMIVWAADTNKENQQVIILNKAENFYWCGYVQPNGVVKDTSFTR